MKTPTSSRIDKEFLTKWLSSLQQYSSSSISQSCSDTNKKPQIITPTTTNTMSTIFQRKRAIKLSADLAMASTRTTTSKWSRALISRARTDYYYYNNSCNNQTVVLQTESNQQKTCERLLLKAEKNTRKARSTIMMKQRRRRRRRRIDHKRAESRAFRMMSARMMAERVVKRRTAVLRGLVPGGEAMDDFCLIREAVDYILSLKAQVDVMQRLADATTTTHHHQTPLSLMKLLNDDEVASP